MNKRTERLSCFLHEDELSVTVEGDAKPFMEITMEEVEYLKDFVFWLKHGPPGALYCCTPAEKKYLKTIFKK